MPLLTLLSFTSLFWSDSILRESRKLAEGVNKENWQRQLEILKSHGIEKRQNYSNRLKFPFKFSFTLSDNNTCSWLCLKEPNCTVFTNAVKFVTNSGSQHKCYLSSKELVRTSEKNLLGKHAWIKSGFKMNSKLNA